MPQKKFFVYGLTETILNASQSIHKLIGCIKFSAYIFNLVHTYSVMGLYTRIVGYFSLAHYIILALPLPISRRIFNSHAEKKPGIMKPITCKTSIIVIGVDVFINLIGGNKKLNI